MLAALSTGHKLGLGLAGVAFVVFALISAVLIPRRRPDFPGSALGIYLAVVVAFFAGMIAAVSIFGKEKKTEKHRSGLVRPL